MQMTLIQDKKRAAASTFPWLSLPLVAAVLAAGSKLVSASAHGVDERDRTINNHNDEC